MKSMATKFDGMVAYNKEPPTRIMCLVNHVVT